MNAFQATWTSVTRALYSLYLRFDFVLTYTMLMDETSEFASAIWSHSEERCKPGPCSYDVEVCLCRRDDRGRVGDLNSVTSPRTSGYVPQSDALDKAVIALRYQYQTAQLLHEKEGARASRSARVNEFVEVGLTLLAADDFVVSALIAWWCFTVRWRSRLKRHQGRSRLGCQSTDLPRARIRIYVH